MKKKTILYHSNYPFSNTGFAKHSRLLLKYLYKTNKYNIINYCSGMTYQHPEFARLPWTCIGSLPNNKQELDEINKDPHLARSASYGSYYIDKVIQEFKPDIYIGSEDPWGLDYSFSKKWWNKISCCIHTTLDSLPILPSVVENAPKIRNFFIWSEFAVKELQKLGHAHVKCVHGIVNTKDFYRLSNEKRLNLREKFKIPQNAFVIGFVFRNQLRKSVPNLLQGYKLFKQQNPHIKNTYLLLHTHFSEGWPIVNQENTSIREHNSKNMFDQKTLKYDLCSEIGIDPKEILCTYVCRNCLQYEVKNFSTQDLNCPMCGAEKSQITCNVQSGVNEEQLNEVYNLMDVYAHPFTSGGQEIPIQEAKLTELITLVTNYSCGEDSCVPEAASLELDWAEYREPGTNFIKASTYPSSIAKQLKKVYEMSIEKRLEMGKKARNWVIENFSPEVIGKIFEDFIDSQPESTYNFDDKELPKNPNAIIPQIEDDGEFIKKLYKDILNMDVNDMDEGYKYWHQILKNI